MQTHSADGTPLTAVKRGFLQHFTAEELARLEPLDSVDRLKGIADLIALIPNQAHKISAAIDIFGRSGTEFVAICCFGKEERDQIIDGYLKTFGWRDLLDLERW